jgi:TonB family protein
LVCGVAPGAAQTIERRTRVAVLEMGDSLTSKHVEDQVAKNFDSRKEEFQVVDRDQANAAALGIGYRRSLNMTLEEARNLGSAIGCDFFFTGDAQTLRRSPSSGPIYFDSYASIFLVSARTGRLIFWESPNLKAATADAAEKALLASLANDETRHRWTIALRRALEDERNERVRAVEDPPPVIEAADGDGESTANGSQPPRPYRRLKPAYTEAAAYAEVEATVDVLVDIDGQGEVNHVEVARWAGYGLDQSVIDTVKQLHFFPAKRDGVSIPMRVLLRYNFRKPPKPNPKP